MAVKASGVEGPRALWIGRVEVAQPSADAKGHSTIKQSSPLRHLLPTGRETDQLQFEHNPGSACFGFPFIRP